ncbi:hypothetical protein MRB53_001852 [Persea americana]|uniref:Uncharacterized protein n=1 Tax=Persea americana TaxID=3435 RepID=A0ACC2MT29_PERAE|nr:hypothetical protein MRB53_001852 [Persea americana]
MEEDYDYPLSRSSSSCFSEELQSSCGQGHRSSFQLKTTEGGSICLLCFSNLISSPTSPPLHISYALSQLSQAIPDPLFLHHLRSFHSHLLIPPLLNSLSSFHHDDSIAHQIVHLVLHLSRSTEAIAADFLSRIADCLASSALAWSRRQIYLLHCFGLLLDSQTDGNPSTHIKDKGALISSLIKGLQLPSEEIRGEVLFVLFKLSILQDAGDDCFSCFCPRLVYLSLEALIKTPNDEVRMNCIALLTMLAQGGYFEFDSSFADNPIPSNSSSREEVNCMPTTELMDGTSIVTLFADAIKGSLLSSDSQVQISALDLIFHSLSVEATSAKHIQILVEESLADYVFEVLRMSENRDPLIVSCLRVLHLLASAEEVIRQSLAIGFPTLIPVLRYVADIPLHPNQFHILKLVWSCISHCPGLVSRSQVEELVLVLTGIFRRHASGEMGMLPETFTMACSTFVTLLTTPSSCGIPLLEASIQEVSRNVILSSFCAPQGNPNQVLLYSLYLLKEAYTFTQKQTNNTNLDNMELPKCIIEICESHILPWIGRAIDEADEEEVILGVLETFHSILLHGPDVHAKKFAHILASSSWFSLSFGCLGLFPSDQMKWRVYQMLSSLSDRILGNGFGQPIRDASLSLPSDPLDLLFLLGQKSSHDSNLISCQSAVLLILYTSSLHDERIADEREVLASLEQYILVNRTNFIQGIVDSATMTRLVHLYGLIRGAEKSYKLPYSTEAEKILFQLIAEREWNLLSTRFHPTALKWLFQQENISGLLSNQILNYCRLNSKNKIEINQDKNNNTQLIKIDVIAGLVAAGDNCAPSVLVSLLKELQEEGQWDDIFLVVDLMKAILKIFPVAANQFCLHGISDAIRSLYYSTHPLHTIFTTCSILLFSILQSANPRMISDHEAWLLVTIKLLELFVPMLAADDTCNQEGHLVMSILSLILYHSTNQTLSEASKAILLNTSLASAVNNVIQAACAKGPALVDHNEETSTGETLLFLLLFCFFSIRSMHTLLEGTLEWQEFLNSSNGNRPLSVICIRCHDLCRLIHFGSSPIKLVASQCLLELLTKISDQGKNKVDELNCSVRYLQSMVAVLQGLVFCGDNEVAMNCGLCLSTILGWENLAVKEKRVIEGDRWFRLLMEELALSLSAPGLAAKSFTNQHKPAAHIAISLLKLDRPQEWMRSVFDHSCISAIVSNLSASNVSVEMVQLFRELVLHEYLNEEQIMDLNHVFQACRKHVYMDSSQEQYKEEQFEKMLAIPDDLGKICNLLIHLMSSSAKASAGFQSEDRRLLEAIEMFSRHYSKPT